MAPLLFALLARIDPLVARQEIPFRTVGFGTNGKIKDGGALVFRDSKVYDAYRKEMGNRGRKPTVDWSKEQVVAIHAAGTGYGGASLQVGKVWRESDGSLEVEAALDPGSQAAIPTPGVVRVLRKEGIYVLIVVGRSKGKVTLKVVDPQKIQGDKRGNGG